jgi:hypothetical protein
LLGLGALLVTITLVSFSFNKYIVKDAAYTPLTKIGLAKYAVAVTLIELVSWIT